MHASEVEAVSLLEECRRQLVLQPPTLSAMFHLGDRIAAGAASGTENASVLTQRVAVVGAVTIDYLWRAVACAVASEGVLPIMYRAPFGAHVQEILDPSSTLYSFAPELIVISPSQRDLITALSISASGFEVASALSTTVALFSEPVDHPGRAQHPQSFFSTWLVPPADRFRGLADRIAAAAPASQICLLNKMLLEPADSSFTPSISPRWQARSDPAAGPPHASTIPPGLTSSAPPAGLPGPVPCRMAGSQLAHQEGVGASSR